LFFIAVGKVGRPRGVKGEFYVLPLTNFPERFKLLNKIFISESEGERVQFTVNSVRIIDRKICLSLKEIKTRTDAEKIKNSYIEIEKNDLISLPEDTYFVFNLIDLEVFSEAGENYGKIKNVIENPGNDIFIVEYTGKEYLIPAVSEFIKTVDTINKKMIVYKIKEFIAIAFNHED